MNKMGADDKSLKALGLNSEATPQEINQAYRDLVKVWHPDRFPNDPRLRRKGEAALKTINEAYDCLRRSAPPSYKQSGIATGRPQYSDQARDHDNVEATSRDVSKTEYAVLLQDVGIWDIGVIMVVRDATGLGPSEAKHLVAGAPCKVKGGLSNADAEILKRDLEDAGATAAIQGPVEDSDELKHKDDSLSTPEVRRCWSDWLDNASFWVGLVVVSAAAYRHPWEAAAIAAGFAGMFALGAVLYGAGILLNRLLGKAVGSATLGWSVVLLVGACLTLLYGVQRWRESWELQRSGVTTVGVVTHGEKGWRSRDEGEPPSISYEFAVNGRTYTGSSGVYVPKGETLLVNYRPSDPNSNHPVGHGSGFEDYVVIAFVLGALGVILARSCGREKTLGETISRSAA